MRVAIVGSGKLLSKIVDRLKKSGFEIVFSGTSKKLYKFEKDTLAETEIMPVPETLKKILMRDIPAEKMSTWKTITKLSRSQAHLERQIYGTPQPDSTKKTGWQTVGAIVRLIKFSRRSKFIW